MPKVYEKNGKKVIAVQCDTLFVDQFDQYCEIKKAHAPHDRKVNQAVIVRTAIEEYMRKNP